MRKIWCALSAQPQAFTILSYWVGCPEKSNILLSPADSVADYPQKWWNKLLFHINIIFRRVLGKFWNSRILGSSLKLRVLSLAMGVLDSSYKKALGVKSQGLNFFLIFTDTLVNSFASYCHLNVLKLWCILNLNMKRFFFRQTAKSYLFST